MPEQQQGEEKRNTLRREIYDLYIKAVWLSQQLNGRLIGDPGGMRELFSEFHHAFGSLFLLTQYDKGMDKVEKEYLAYASWWLALRMPVSPGVFRKYVREGVFVFNWYQQMLVLNGVIVVEND